MNTQTQVRYRRTTRVAALSGAVLAAAALALPAAADEEFVPGSGDAHGIVARFGPTTGGLSLSSRFGLSLADYRVTFGRGQSQAVDMGAVALSLTSEGCDGNAVIDREQLPPTLVVDSRQDGSEEGRTITYQGTPAESPVVVAAGRQHARATDQPLGHGATEVAPIDIGGVITIAGGRSAATTELADQVREARASVDIPEVSVGGGELLIRGLHWDVVQRTGPDPDADPEVTSSFRIDGVSLAGTDLGGADNPEEAAELLGGLNDALAPSGLRLEPPTLSVIDGVATVSPLRLAIVNSPAGAATVGPVLGGLQVLRQPLFDAIISARCRSAGVILVGDVFLAVPAGSGRLDLDLGGVVATTEGEQFDNPFGAGSPFGAGADDGAGAGSPAGPGSTPAGPMPTVPGPASRQDPAAAPPLGSAATDGAGRGSELATFASSVADGHRSTLAALAALAVLAVGSTAASDRRRALRAARLAGSPA